VGRVVPAEEAILLLADQPGELDNALTFLRDQRALYATQDPNDVRPWSDLAHVLFNVKEFIYLN